MSGSSYAMPTKWTGKGSPPCMRRQMFALPARMKGCYRGFALSLLSLFVACVHEPQRKAEPAPLNPIVKPANVDHVLLLKSRRMLYLMQGDTILQGFPVALGKNPIGPKRRTGDGRTPEGVYGLDWRNPNSQFYRSIHISYPNDNDIARARRSGVSPGGAIMIHGLPNGQGHIGARHLASDWTDGCVAVTNEEMDIIWHMVDDDTPIEIRP